LTLKLNSIEINSKQNENGSYLSVIVKNELEKDRSKSKLENCQIKKKFSFE
jgi:hypothetical protein